ncbi:MAG TPA: glycosyltransferase family 4 protein, partial [Acidimicrobiales bacterium]
AEAGLDLPFVYDAFNVEADLKAAVLPDSDVGRKLLAQVIEVEGAAMRGATAVTACSSIDADELSRRYGRDRADITVIPNGTDIDRPLATAEVRARRAARWQDRYSQVGLSGRRREHLAVFFGSWHPPNLDAVRLLIELAPQLDHTLIVGVGSHGMAFADESVPANVVFPGVVTDTVKDALLGCADVALNPMRTGSGTNLKLLEYLAAGAPVVSTPFGARGIDVVDQEHLLLAEPDAYAVAVTSSLADPAGARRRAEAGRSFVAARYAWPALGDRLWAVVSTVAGTRTPTSAGSSVPVGSGAPAV